MLPNAQANEYLELYGAQAPRMVKEQLRRNVDKLWAKDYWIRVLWYVEEQLANCGARKRG